MGLAGPAGAWYVPGGMSDAKTPGRRDRDAATIVATSGPTTDARNRGILTVLSGAEVGRVVAVPAGGLRLGRSEDCEIHFDDVSLSRVHARALSILGEQFVLRDEGSTNGTFVNGARIADAVRLQDGDRLQLGTETFLRFSIASLAEEQVLMRVFEAGRTDGLTGVANRKAFDERLESEVSFARRHSAPLSLVMSDIDFFKRVNDGFGHPAGDAVLRSVAGLLAREIRAEDAVARYGGEEFAVIVRGVPLFGACLLADRVRTRVAAGPVTFDGKSISVTISAGVASLDCCGASADSASLVRLADARLYKAKESGRNRVIGED
jgi:two-component system cell cycle response regulator